jgi:hypothetical protein
MAYQDDIALMAHLMRRAGFGAGRDELEARAAKGYEATVEELLHPETQPAVDVYTLLRYQPASLLPGGQPPMGNVNIMYHLVNTKRPLEEKVALFWHQVFATGNSKVDNYDQLLEQIGIFPPTRHGQLPRPAPDVARNPTMIFWLDNNQNHGTAVNENWGRELLELFSMGVGAYTEKDVREASAPSPAGPSRPDPRLPYGRFPWKFEYRPEDHDDGEKSFSATAAGSTARTSSTSWWNNRPVRFVCRHLTTSSSPTSPGCPPGRRTAARPKAIDSLTAAFRQSRFDIAPSSGVFNSSFFKNARFSTWSPAEVVVGSLRLVGGYELPRPGYGDLSMQPLTGQDLLNPPSVEGWHTGPEWINSGSLMARINFVADWSVIRRCRASAPSSTD